MKILEPLPDTPSHAAARSHPKYRADIDGLRAIAVLAVVLFHAYPHRLKGGFIGVDVFFVISGYLISTIIFSHLRHGTFSFAEFYARRIKRIFPALLLVLASCQLFGWFALFADEYRQLGKHMAGGAGFVANLVLWGEAGYFDNSAESKPLLHLWSLGIEEQFYFAWPLLLWFAWKRKLNLFTVALALALVSFWLNLHGMRHDTVAAFYSPFTRFWELAAGGLLAWIGLHRSTARAAVAARLDGWLAAALYRDRRGGDGATLANFMSCCGLSLLAYGVSVMHADIGFPGKWALLPVAGAILLIDAGPAAWLNRRVLSHPVMVWIGLISFPLYLWHWPLLAFARILQGDTPSVAIRTGAVLLAVVLAWLTYRLVEQPLRHGAHGRARVVGLACAMALLGVTGYATYARDGFPARAAQQVISANEFDIKYKQPCTPLTGEVYDNDWCSSGTSTSRPASTMLVGDSFASAYSTMFNAYAAGAGEQFSFIQFGRGLCPGLLGYGIAPCHRLADASLDYARRTPSVTTVVLAARWPIYFNGADYTRSGHKETPEAFRTALEATIEAYRKDGKRVLVLLSPPTGAVPRSCVVRTIRLNDSNHCDRTLASARENDGAYRDYMLALLQRLNIAHFDPFPYLCNDTTCTVAEDNKIYYADEGHLSTFGGMFLANKARSDLDALFAPQR